MDNDIRQMIMDAASAAIEFCCENTSYGQWYVSWYEIEDYISGEDFDKYYDDIIDELWSREEVADVYACDDGDIDLCCYGAWCKNLEECEANEDLINNGAGTCSVEWPKIKEA